jgi:hypothetical protein
MFHPNNNAALASKMFLLLRLMWLLKLTLLA